MIWLVSALVTASHARPLLQKIAACPKSDGPKVVRILKQWTLSPTTYTKDFKEKYPQERNLTAVYQALVDDVKKKKIDLVVGEGCEGPIDKAFKIQFNGWSVESLSKVALTKGFDRIITSVPMKLAARFDDKLKVVCGDSDALIQEGNVRLTNLRGWAGYLTHLKQSYVDDQGKLYADGAADLLKISRATPRDEIIAKVKDRIREELGSFRKAIHERNDGFVKVVSDAEFKTAAIVINGLHAEDLKTKLQAAGLGCEVYEPPGYQREEERLIQDFEKLLE